MKKGKKTIEVNGYFSDDGKFFASEEQCKEHEAECLFYKISDKVFDDSFHKKCCIDDITYFAPENKEDIQTFLKVHERYEYDTEGISLNSPISIYKYDDYNGNYVDMIQQCKELITEINSVVPNTIPENIF